MKTRFVVVMLMVIVLFGVTMAAALPGASVAQAADPTPTQPLAETPTPAPTGGPGNVIMNYKARGKGAEASWQTVDETGCIYSYTYVAVNEWISHTQPGAPVDQPAAWVNIYTYDACTGLFYGDILGSAPLQDGEFTIDRKLNEASLNVTIHAYQNYSTPVDIQVSLVWAGISEASRWNDTVTIHEPGYKYTSHFDGSFRVATASGSVSDGTTEYASGWQFYSQMFSAKIAQITLVQGQ